MYTRCPECKTAYRIGIDQVRAGKGEVQCEHCHTVFNALSSLATTVKDSSESDPAKQAGTPVLGERESVALPLFERERLKELDSAETVSEGGADMAIADRARGNRRPGSFQPPDSLLWGGAAAGLLLLLGIQVLGFEGGRLAQNAHVRPGLDGLCSVIGCELPPFKDPSRIAIVDRALSAARDNKDVLEFRLVFANRSELPQALPDIRLALDALEGRPVAERVFTPMEYLGEWQEGDVMPIGKPYEVRLSLAKTSQEVGGFTIDFQ